MDRPSERSPAPLWRRGLRWLRSGDNVFALAVGGAAGVLLRGGLPAFLASAVVAKLVHKSLQQRVPFTGSLGGPTCDRCVMRVHVPLRGTGGCRC